MSEGQARGELRAPVRDHLRRPLTEAAVQRLWRGVGERRARAARPLGKVTAAALVFAGAAILLALFFYRAGAGADVARAPSLAGPLTLAGGGEIGALEAGPSAPAPPAFQLSDGSSIELSPGARLSALESTDRAFAALLAEGRAAFNVQKGGPRRWSIECGLATVEVVGTRFVIERTAARVLVVVMEGVVLVRGERVPDRVKRLGAGESIAIEGERADASGAAKEPAAEQTPAERAQAEQAQAEQAQAAIEPAPREPPRKKQLKAAAEAPFLGLARRGDYRGAYAALGPEGLKRESERDDVGALLLLADIARLSGHAAEAVAPLSRIVTRHAGDPRAAIAAFTLGRLELDALGQPARAAQSFKAALDLGLKEPLIEDAQARLVEARARAGDPSGAREAAAAYERRFPEGRRLKDVRRWAHGE